VIGDIKFRAGTPKDARRFEEIDRLCFAEGIAFSSFTFRYHLRDPKSVNIVAESTGGIIGFAVGKIYRGGEATIVTVDILPEFRRLGIGHELLSRLEEALISKGAAILILQVAVDNIPAMSLYKKSGYKAASVLQEYYPSPNRLRGSDAYLMVKYPFTK
jgi:ribosomal-protein-alanine N-acetyltransferase